MLAVERGNVPQPLARRLFQHSGPITRLGVLGIYSCLHFLLAGGDVTKAKRVRSVATTIHALWLSIICIFLGSPVLAATEQTQLEDKTIDLQSGTLTYKDSGGKGVPVLFVHQYQRLMWDKQIAAFTKAGYRFIALDIRERMSGYASTVDELTARLGIQKFHLVGTGGTGGAAMQYGLANPDRVRSIVATNCLIGVRDPALNAVEASLRSAQFDANPAFWRELSPSYRAADPEGVKRWQELASARPVRPPMTASGPASAPTAAPATNQPNPSAVTLERLNNSLKVPFVLVVGDGDQYTPPSVMRMLISQIKKNASGIVIPESGHNSQWENPEAFNRELLRFISKH